MVPSFWNDTVAIEQKVGGKRTLNENCVKYHTLYDKYFSSPREDGDNAGGTKSKGRETVQRCLGRHQTLSRLKEFTWHVSILLKEPPHDKTNKMTVRPAKTQISLAIHPV